jgi:hypothetical protein
MSRPTTAVVIAAGEASRWGEYLGVPKHLIDIDGEPLLHRTVRQLVRQVSTVWVVARNDDRYREHVGHTYTVDPNNSDMDKFYSGRALWKGHTLIVYGDTFFTDDAIDTICGPTDDWHLYCRPHGSSVTGSPYGECFAFSVPGHRHDLFRDTVVHVAGMHELGQTPRAGGWELYRALLGQSLTDHVMGEHHTVIDDFTEDFDTPADYDLWAYRRDQ